MDEVNEQDRLNNLATFRFRSYVGQGRLIHAVQVTEENLAGVQKWCNAGDTVRFGDFAVLRENGNMQIWDETSFGDVFSETSRRELEGQWTIYIPQVTPDPGAARS